MKPGLGIEPGTHWWKASALTTAPTLLPQANVLKSLFTSIPVDLALTIINERLRKDQDLAERTNMSISNIMRLLDFVLNHNYFEHNAIYYKQIFGCAMGSLISPVIARSPRNGRDLGNCHRHSSPPP